MYVKLFLNSLFCSFDLHVLSISLPISHCFDYCHCILVLNLRNVIPPTLVLFFKIVLAIRVPLPFHMNFKISVSIYNVCTGTFLFVKGDKKMPRMKCAVGK